MKIEITASAIAGFVTFVGYVWMWAKILAKIAEPLIIEAEKLAQDGTLDRDDRKKIVMMAIDGLEKEGKIKINFITRIILSFVVDQIAKRLPDFTITKDAQNLIANKLNELKVSK